MGYLCTVPYRQLYRIQWPLPQFEQFWVPIELRGSELFRRRMDIAIHIPLRNFLFLCKGYFYFWHRVFLGGYGIRGRGPAADRLRLPWRQQNPSANPQLDQQLRLPPHEPPAWFRPLEGLPQLLFHLFSLEHVVLRRWFSEIQCHRSNPYWSAVFGGVLHCRPNQLWSI
jgi:hypothetical protein